MKHTGVAPVVILGGGASGVLLALHLARDAARQIIVVERSRDLGAGIAYATEHPEHLLNVRAANMSAFPDDPGHFTRWLDGRRPTSTAYGPEDFAPRRLYHAYLADLVAPLLRSGGIRHVRGEAMSLRAGDGDVTVTLGEGLVVSGEAAVVATGNEGPAFPPAPWRHQGWGDPGPCRVDPTAPVAVIGTGLTMVDRVLWLLHGGHRGPITAVSRHGLMPAAHRPGTTPSSYPESVVPTGTSVARLTRWLRDQAVAAEAEGLDWRAAVDGLRPHTQAIWRSLPAQERRRFLRHLQPFWSIHRHRIAPPAAERMAAARASGQLRIVAGRVAGHDERPPGVVLTVQRRHGGTERVEAAALFECRGRSGAVADTDNPLLRDILSSGSAVPDALGLGLAVREDGALFDAAGRASDRLYALGPVTAGTFWEITAVPDIRLQASRLAATLGLRAARRGDASASSLTPPAALPTREGSRAAPPVP